MKRKIFSVETRVTECEPIKASPGIFPAERVYVTVEVFIFNKCVFRKSERKIVQNNVPFHPNCRCAITDICDSGERAAE